LQAAAEQAKIAALDCPEVAMPRLALTLIAALLLAWPAMAQTPDFGDDSSPFANDGECDDPRFAGPGMTSTLLLQTDIRADAGDCRAAFAAGRVTLPDAGSTAPGKPVPQANPGAAALDFGDDSGRWPNDGECDDRRFAGAGMAVSFGWAQVGRDAADCRSLLTAGRVSLWVLDDARAATACSAVSFGIDAGEYADDGECDDIRFEGPGAAGSMGQDHVSRDATDCARLCRFGAVALRDY